MTAEKMTGYPSIDKPWLKYYSEKTINVPLPKCTIYESIYENNRNYPNDIALLYFGKKITYKKLFAEIEKTAKAFVTVGVKAGDNVALCTPAVPEAIYSILALNRLGANAVMLNPTFPQAQLLERIRETEASVLFVVNEVYHAVEKLISQTQIETIISCPAVNSLGAVVKTIKKVKKIEGTLKWNCFISQGKSAILPGTLSYQPQYSALMVYSSGTTGASKGIQLTNDSINATITDYGISGFDIERQDRYFAQIPIWFSTGIAITILVPLFYGITVILEPMYDFEIFYKHITKYRPHFLITASGLLDYLMENRPINPSYAFFKYLVVGGEYVTSQFEKKCNAWLEKNRNFNMLHKGYGMCECGGTVTSTTANCNAISSSGIPTPHVTVAAFDLETGIELKYGQRGELRVLTPCGMSGYFNNPEATASFFREDEQGRVWSCTGDMGYVAEDGSVYVDGRISESYQNENGKTVYLFDIERAILSAPNARQCRVVTSEVDGKITHIAHVTLMAHNTQEKVLSEIMAVCKEKLDSDHMPTLIKFYPDALPIAASGKIDTAALAVDNSINTLKYI